MSIITVPVQMYENTNTIQKKSTQDPLVPTLLISHRMASLQQGIFIDVLFFTLKTHTKHSSIGQEGVQQNNRKDKTGSTQSLPLLQQHVHSPTANTHKTDKTHLQYKVLP